MAITDKTRKLLWGKSGNRCSICKTELFTNKDNETIFNLGEECHIISSKKNGPRHKSEIEDYDLYDNLILLCRNHHKEIDELTDTYTEELLRYVKKNHENWVRKTINKAINEKEEAPRFLARITSGKELLRIITDSHGYRTDYDEPINEEEVQYIGNIFQTLTDYGDISYVFEPYDRIQVGHELNDLLKDIEEKGYFLFGEENIEKRKFKDGEVLSWKVATLVLKRKDSEEIIKLDLDKM
ncbi:HNH endonuclease signature motif containing protein [Bacteroides sp.]|uniref:HNH endonuclease signature motif containing protein n=1 Tax=Bacteroides sp. TaxID=29523 RepID=UPI0025BC73FD|nr:HNH endonuclease signature motif containing protein [Bacteroides sp.]